MVRCLGARGGWPTASEGWCLLGGGGGFDRRGTCSATAWVVDVRIHSEDAGELHRHGRIWQRSNRTTADTILESDATTQEQTRRLARLTRWLIALTVVLVVLTFVLVGVTTALFWVTSHPT